jgi:acyl dehydratase
MPLQSSALGTSAGYVDVTYDARWTMGYSAGVPDERPELYATDAPNGVLVHPLFPVAPEWALIISGQAHHGGLEPDEARRGIHVGHDLVLHRPLRADEQVRLAATFSAVGRRRAGATQELLFTATDTDGSIVWRTRMTSLLLGVELVGEPTSVPLDWPATPERPTGDAPVAVVSSEVSTVAAHVYSECARIWNPIHTDVVAARRAGLAEPILHGTATLARSVSLACGLADVSLDRVQRVMGGFSAPVPLGSSFQVRLLAVDDDHLWFDAVLADGTAVLRDGLLGLRA